MNTVHLPTDPKELRPLVHQKVDEIAPGELAAVHHFLIDLEARRLFDQLGREFDADWADGKISHDSIDAAIREHRRKHPY